MPTKTLLISTLTDANPYTIGSAPDNLVGYTQPAGSDAARVGVVLGQKCFYLSGATETMWLDNTILTGTTVYARATLPGTVGGSAAGVVLADINGTGHEVIFGATTNNFRVFATLNGKLTGGALAGGTYAVPPVGNAVIELSHTGTTLTVKQNGSTLGSVTSITRPTDVRAGMSSRGGLLVSMESEYAAAQSVVSINGGNDIEVGEAGIPAVLSGFTGAITSITTDQTGMTVSGITGTTNAPVFNVSGWEEDGPYSELPVSTSFTFNYLTESASGSETVTYPAGWVKQTFSGAVIDNDRYFGYIFDDAGHTVDGSVLYYDPAPIPGLVINPDTSWEPVAEGGTFDAWLRSPAGNMYYFELTIQEDGTATGRGITAVGLTMSGITMRGITAVGL